MSGGLLQLIAYTQKDYNKNVKTIIRDHIEYKYVSCRSTMSFRKYNNFEIAFDDITIGKDLYNSNDLIYIYPINLRYKNSKPILDNSKIIKLIKLEEEAIINNEKKEKEKKEKKERKIEMEKERKRRKAFRPSALFDLSDIGYNYRKENACRRAERSALSSKMNMRR